MDGLSDIEKISVMIANDGIMVNRIGLSRKHIFDAVDASVARLGTYLDVLQIHRLDRDTPREEIMKALNDVVESGKVRYIGASSVSVFSLFPFLFLFFLFFRSFGFCSINANTGSVENRCTPGNSKH
jgi:predicted aldo/keto reductase-like oxidoreductase